MLFLKGWDDVSVSKVFAGKPKEPSSSLSIHLKAVCPVILGEVEQENPWSSVSNQASLAKSAESMFIKRPCLRLRSEQQDGSVGKSLPQKPGSLTQIPRTHIRRARYVCDCSTPVGRQEAETEKAG